MRNKWRYFSMGVKRMDFFKLNFVFFFFVVKQPCPDLVASADICFKIQWKLSYLFYFSINVLFQKYKLLRVLLEFVISRLLPRKVQPIDRFCWKGSWNEWRKLPAKFQLPIFFQSLKLQQTREFFWAQFWSHQKNSWFLICFP